MKIRKSEIEKLIYKFQLGEVEEINIVPGGLSHKMYQVKTKKETYAIKVLNPGIMKKPEAYSNFVFSEKIALIAEKNGIPLVRAMELELEKIIQQIDQDYFMVFKWIEGSIRRVEEVGKKECYCIGELLAKLHQVDFSSQEDEKRKIIEKKKFEWSKYLEIAKKQKKPYYQMLKDKQEWLYDLNIKSNQALEQVEENLIISHRDLDPKNIIWQEEKPYIIDWEASGYINPIVELVLVGWYWSNGEQGFDEIKFKSVIEGYYKHQKRYPNQRIEEFVYADLQSGLEWIDYNLKRSLSIENTYDKEEIQLAENEVIQSMEEIAYHINQIDKIRKIMP